MHALNLDRQLARCRELGATLAAGLELGVF